MNITGCYNLHTIICELETILQIDGADLEERNMDVVIRNVKTRISRQYQIELADYKIDSDELAVGPYRNALSIFIDNVARVHGKLSGYGQIARYLTNIQISLSSINYLGFVQTELKALLIALQRKRTAVDTTDAVKAIKDRLGSINICWEKRLFILLIVSEALGFNELTAAIAEILYLSVVR